ncbi:MAG: disulfide bond formation protein B [Gammaproteobacteria bacterium]|nr:disulfide bond formation protein B [Gammaproteobacteria bacterium]
MQIGVRGANALGALACAGLMAYALYAQHVLGLEPCPLCIFQRVAVIGLGLAFAGVALHGPGPAGRRAWGVLLGVAAAGGAGVAGRHLWLQSLPPERVPACGPGLDYMIETFPFTEVLQTVLSGSGECAQVDWHFLGLAMPAWVLVCVVALGAAGLWNNWRRA